MEIAPRNLIEAAQVQVALADALGGRLTDSPWPAGFKIGATGTRMQALLGLSGPAAGFMRRDDIYSDEAALPFGDWRGPGVECELAVVLAHDLPPAPCTEQEAAAAVGDLCAAIELVENRYGPPPIGDLQAVGTLTLVADQVYHAAAVVGAPIADWQSLDLAAIVGTLFIDGIERDRGKGAELLGHPLRGLAWLAGSEVAAAFGGLRAGQTIMLGSVVPTCWVDGPCDVRVGFDGTEGAGASSAHLQLV